MLFTQPVFLLFFAVVFALHWSLRSQIARKALLLVGSYAFYAAWDWRFLSLILISTCVDFIAAKRIEQNTNHKKHAKKWLIISLLVNLGMLAFFKYFNFFAESAADLMTALGMSVNQTTLNVILPVGISFYTFQTMSYTIDVYRKKLKAEKNLLDVALFVAFFPQLVAGPIVRAIDFLPQLHVKAKWASIPFKACFLLFLVGYFKKAGVSDNIAPFVDQIFADPALYTSASLMAGVFLYAIQIYCDFSGYTDMAIACAALLGYKLPKNFDAPYLATSIVDFWRRWHISLSTWLRDYLYIPLGGNKNGALQRYRNLMITMLLGGLWHGAAWTFVFWGFLHGAALSLNHLCSHYAARFIPKFIGLMLTFVFICAAWVFFRSADFQTAIQLLSGVVGLDSEESGSENLPRIAFTAVLFLAALHIIWQKLNIEDKLKTLNERAFYIVCGGWVAVLILLQPQSYQAFIYFQF